MPFVAYVHASDPEPDDEARQPWEPRWRVWRWVAGSGLAGYGAIQADGAVETLLVFVAFALICRVPLELFPGGDGLRDYRQ